MFKKTITVALVLLIIIVIWFVNLLWSAGQFKTIEPHFEGACTQVNAGKAGNGAIYAYNLNAPDPVLFNLTSNMGRDFQPHGISLYVDNNGKGFLFAINHARGVHTIEVYELIGIALYHTKTISDPMLVSPNDLVAVGPDSFYVSNDHGHVSGIMRVMEDYLKLPLSNVVYYDGSRFSEAASGIKYANGINVSSDGKTLYLCAVTELSLRLYDREVSSGKLSLREKIKLDTGVDNIEIDNWIRGWIISKSIHQEDFGSERIRGC
ncbi:MAG: SMP-30/gluconolactonase/LRE family protein [Deltaproteobacteria bacterium]|nr:SMP-30/gluconolactonase/LRE family protein [Deltaproteobacteria bacterium]